MNRKSVITLCAILSISLSSVAFASRARLLVGGFGDGGNILVGNGNGGSFYYDDPYNFFYNPAYANDSKDSAIIEKSNFNGSTAQGGFSSSFLNYSVGTYFNRTNALAHQTNGSNMHPIDLVVTGDVGLKWGLGLMYGRWANGFGTDQDLTIRAGAQLSNGLDPFLEWRAYGYEKAIRATNGGQFQSSIQHLHYQAGFRYHWGEWIPYAAFRRDMKEHIPTNRSWGFGMGRTSRVSEIIKASYAISFWKNSAAAPQTGAPAVTSQSRSMIPIDLFVEIEALSWLTLRGGLAYRIFDQVEQSAVDGGGSATGKTVSDNTTGRIGAAIHFSKVDFEWAVGKTSGTTEAASTADGQVFDIASGFFTAASLSYHW